jgi:hypothetical protein
MMFVLGKQTKRRLDEDKDTEFEINGREVPPHKLQRFMQRKNISEQMVVSCSAG